MTVESKTAGWDWGAFFLGPFWYLSKGMKAKGVWLLIFSVFSCFMAAPFIWVYCGARGRGDLYDYSLQKRSRINLNEI
ncbi:MAG: hypothetical protein K0A99_07675 [Desulfoarculaceae bacterium]|nr:hypothetical protein [Desulfoarculaceae bacterium]